MVNPRSPRRPKDKTARRKPRRQQSLVPRPHWVPLGFDFDSLPEQLKISLVEFVNPAYEQLVLQAADALERATGLSLIYLLWIELLNQLHLGESYTQDHLIRSITAYQECVDRNLEISEAKAKQTYVLLRLRELRHLSDPQLAASPAPRLTCTSAAIVEPAQGEPHVAEAEIC
jgi:hypothetical protein